jgi:hypothetical protein
LGVGKPAGIGMAERHSVPKELSTHVTEAWRDQQF